MKAIALAQIIVLSLNGAAAHRVREQALVADKLLVQNQLLQGEQGQESSDGPSCTPTNVPPPKCGPPPTPPPKCGCQEPDPGCLGSQACDKLGCTFGIERFYRGQDSMRTLVPHAKFVDAHFPASATSLYWKRFVKNQKDAMTAFEKVKQWARPPEILAGKDVPSLWGAGGLSNRGVKQGLLGDGWLLGAAAAIAERPERIKNVFTQREYTDEGIFELWLHYKGAGYKVVVDDRLPMYRMPGTPIATQMSDNGAWWLPILEKGYAKLHQNYARLSGGLSFEAVRTLTGMPTIPHFPMYYRQKYDDNTLWSILSEGDKKNYVMSGGIFKNKFGLVSGHAYTIIGVNEVTHNNKIEKLVKIRNPWAKENYTGPWSGSDARWTDDTRKQVGGLTQANEGIFHMPFAEFKDVFGSFAVGMYETTWMLSQAVLYPKEKTLAIRFVNPVQQEVAATLDGIPARMVPETCAPDWPDKVPGQVAIIGPGNRVLDKQIIFPNHNYGWLHVKSLPAGEYILYVQFQGKGPAANSGLHNITLSTYGLRQCLPIHGSPCAAVPSASPNSTADAEEGKLALTSASKSWEELMRRMRKDGGTITRYGGGCNSSTSCKNCTSNTCTYGTDE